MSLAECLLKVVLKGQPNVYVANVDDIDRQEYVRLARKKRTPVVWLSEKRTLAALMYQVMERGFSKLDKESKDEFGFLRDTKLRNKSSAPAQEEVLVALESLMGGKLSCNADTGNIFFIPQEAYADKKGLTTKGWNSFLVKQEENSLPLSKCPPTVQSVARLYLEVVAGLSPKTHLVIENPYVGLEVGSSPMREVLDLLARGGYKIIVLKPALKRGVSPLFHSGLGWEKVFEHEATIDSSLIAEGSNDESEIPVSKGNRTITLTWNLDPSEVVFHEAVIALGKKLEERQKEIEEKNRAELLAHLRGESPLLPKKKLEKKEVVKKTVPLEPVEKPKRIPTVRKPLSR